MKIVNGWLSPNFKGYSHVATGKQWNTITLDWNIYIKKFYFEKLFLSSNRIKISQLPKNLISEIRGSIYFP